ncbi:VOC family protein [Burkholderia sp. S171]|uniref:VOC family protein n=1 Tax=Burkholderia sp. S171 TaxID=1641860 RepID=UPI00131C5104|nr:VOC family protein [Burkholderia sp. S171]
MQSSNSTSRLGIHSIGAFSLTVPSLDEAHAFYDAFGLHVHATPDGLSLHTDNGWRWGDVVQGPRKQMRHIRFHCYAEDYDALRTRIAANGVETFAAPDWAEDRDGTWFADPDGLTIAIHPGPKTTLDAAVRHALSHPVDGVRAAANRRDRPRVRPVRLSHIMRFTADVPRAIDFYTRVLGLRLSDRSADHVAFLHGPHGSDHHLMAFAKSQGPGLHHLSWDVPTIEEVGLGAMHMAACGYKKGWGVGRHVLGSNYFFYVADPWGSFSEYSAEMDFIPASLDWHPLDHPAEDSSYLWGPDVPAYMRENAELG